MLLEARAVSHATPITTSRAAPCRFTMSVGNERCARNALPDTFNIGVFNSVKNNPTTMKHVYNESGNGIEVCNGAFAASDILQTVPVFGIKSMVIRVRLRYTRDYLTPGICSLIKPAAME